MKIKQELFVSAPALLLCVMLVSCVTGQYLSMKAAETAEVMGTVQSVFVVNGSFRYRSVINSQAYLSLLAEAHRKYPGVEVDIRDISWVIGRQFDTPNNYEYTAIGKVIKIP
ncbi:MAG: hypothetical protein LBD48_00495 [Treponema sp.]|jgi:hypothetical protein|nr:hypothetical protein [Treponema sp.]